MLDTINYIDVVFENCDFVRFEDYPQFCKIDLIDITENIHSCNLGKDVYLYKTCKSATLIFSSLALNEISHTGKQIKDDSITLKSNLLLRHITMVSINYGDESRKLEVYVPYEEEDLYSPNKYEKYTVLENGDWLVEIKKDIDL